MIWSERFDNGSYRWYFVVIVCETMAAAANQEQFGPLLRKPAELNNNVDDQLTVAQQFSFHLTSLLNICFALALLVTVPLYNDFYIVTKSDSYNALYFVVSISTLLLVLLTSVPAVISLRKLCASSYNIANNASRSSTTKTILKLLANSFIFTISLLFLSYCRAKDRVPCHLQDGLLFLAVPVSVMYMTLIKRKKHVSSDAIRLIVYLTVYMGLIFASSVFQLSYRWYSSDQCEKSTVSDSLFLSQIYLQRIDNSKRPRKPFLK